MRDCVSRIGVSANDVQKSLAVQPKIDRQTLKRLAARPPALSDSIIAHGRRVEGTLAWAPNRTCTQVRRYEMHRRP